VSTDLRISEIFGPTIQGEGALIGEPTVFVRTGGCDYRCVWCDTLHAVDSAYRDTWTPMAADAVMVEILRLSGNTPLTVSLSGGNPAIQPLGDVIALGKPLGYRFALETQGSIARDWFAALDVLVLSPKPPSSEMTTDWDMLRACVDAAGPDTQTILKIVVFDDADYAYARDVASRFPHLRIVLQPGNPTPPTRDGHEPVVDIEATLDRTRALVDRVTQDRWFNARVLPQLHVLLWGNRRGV